MKNRIRKLLFGSVTRELLLTIVLSVTSISLIFDVIPDKVSDAVSSIISNALHIITLSIIPGIVVMLLISSKFKNRFKELVFGSVTRELLLSFSLILISVKLFPNIITILLLIYLLVRRKAEYIKNICNGIKIISEGNLDYKIVIQGHDELAILAEEINNMSLKLKNKIEEERAAERLKSELITNVSHDLRTPLTALIGYIQLAADDKMSFEDKDKYTKISLEKSKKLKVLIDDLFEYSKLESGGIKLEKVKVNIIEIIEQSIGELSIKAKERCIGFNKNFKNSKVELLVDPNKIARVFENIIGNAVKYSLEGSDVNINLYENNENVIISFENIVESISEEDLDKIFNRFYRTDESRNSEIAGSGLGLAITKSIVELHEGKIWVKNEDDKFIINIELNADYR
ncbi:HAMP domain-containing sensor histidine kinase [uncultured Clostridium sp.]|uniref:sensor histidine kinase n=1 Tax=uncultured Clostridium sp. TaxID=59620 RepID=UPI0028E51358|nr:HAMP domain-containing sensor histidine kinase [uncultured Clostridium sp.]